MVTPQDGHEWRESVAEAAWRLLNAWDVSALPDPLRRNNFDYYYLSVWPGLSSLHLAAEAVLPARPSRTQYAYVHIPFCSGVCSFCSYFFTVARDPESDSRVSQYLTSLLSQARIHQTETELNLSYLYFGGGTPSSLHPRQLEQLLAGFSRLGILSQQLIGTVEVHPEAVADAVRANLLLDVLEAYGIRRVSVGYQTDNDEILRATNRRHGRQFLSRAMEMFRSRDFTVNIDLMYGLPGQTLESWIRSIQSAIAIHPDSISTYFTFLNAGTPLWQKARRDAGILLSHDDIQLQHLAAQIALEREGFIELPGDFYSKPTSEPADYKQEALPSDANMVALGVGTYGYYPGVQYFNCFDFRRYTEMIGSGRSPIWRAAVLSDEEEMRRDIMFSLKNAPALNARLFQAKYGVGPLDVVPHVWSRLSNLELVQLSGQEVRLTGKGRLVVEEIACMIAPPRHHGSAAESHREADLLTKHNFAPTYPMVKEIGG